MTVRFILGRSGTNKSEWMMNDIENRLRETPIGPAIFYIVPDQMTFQLETALFSREHLSGSIRAQVASFSRLAWRILQETGGGLKPFISSVGTQMMLRKIISEKNGDWMAFEKAIKKQGFLDQLESVIQEFKRYEITPDALRMQQDQFNKFVHQSPSERGLVRKLDDFIYIYEQLLRQLQHSYMDNEDRLQLLKEKIPQANILEGAHIYIDGFHRFTPQEISVITELMKKCAAVHIGLTVDPRNTESLQELDIFYQTNQTYQQLIATAEEIGVSLDPAVYLDPSKDQFKNRAYFAHLEQNFDVRPLPEYPEKAPIQIAEAVHPRAEVEGVAQEILTLVRDEGYRYRDISILVRQSDVYDDLIETIFEDHDIPVFIDQKRSMLHHPLIELIRSMLEAVENGWRSDAIFRVLKTGFIPAGDEKFPLTRDAIDQLENYTIEYGVRYRKQWLDAKPWKFQRFRGFDQAAQTNFEREMQEEINRYRDQVTQALHPFDEKFRAANSVKERCEAIFLWLEALGIPEKLEAMRASFDEQGLPEKGREQQQVWDAIVQLMDEMVEIAGDEELDLSTFIASINAGFEALEFSHVPPTMDHVLVGTIDRSRMSGVRCAFLLGVNEGIWPMKPQIDGMIDDEERDLLEQNGLKLADNGKRQLLDDWFYIYLSLTVATDRLMISYPISDEEGKAKVPSQVIGRIEDLFPVCREHLLFQDVEDAADTTRFITTKTKSRAALTTQFARMQRGYEIDNSWFAVYNWYVKNQPPYGMTHRILQGLFYKNQPEQLKKETAKELYPKQIKASVSRLESYYRCSYQHFARYSLNLKERQTYKLDAPDIGQLFHEALRLITEWVQNEKTDFKELTKESSANYAHRAINKLSPVLQHQILHSSNRYTYIQQKLEEIIARAAFILSEQARQTDFSPVGLELSFGEKDSPLPPLVLPLENGYELLLRGRIDRVDKAELHQDLYLRIIDYKSSSRALDLLEVYYGLALQMLTYLDVVLTHSEQWLGQQANPAGVLYFHVHNPMINLDNEKIGSDIEEKIFKSYKMRGLLLSDEEIAKMMDASLDMGSSNIIPAGLKKDGTFRSNSKIADEKTFEQLKNHIHVLLQKAGLDMTSGGVAINPYLKRDTEACTYCPFHAVCQFDPALEGNHYRKISNMKEEEIIEKLKGGEIRG
ncbi:helicase-exonuclease AddAB subunit AddB [Oceanobacillus sp. J11TS1]|uniref:helicase-exonuclease AddAB subunit AddB n=1 Tax=Oceanobacillus sp. J11TS1 TaxID=2807191 RepID=UPI001B170993|nr:helicase-exonuclease AddAB subunit AddB [Oceanobacillus sp. J11TS1]GIO21653.1 ATP-dependent helicase/deoxyribonuclease subunit B [Oceanobacillus sp. J11TS1]